MPGASRSSGTMSGPSARCARRVGRRYGSRRSRAGSCRRTGACSGRCWPANRSQVHFAVSTLGYSRRFHCWGTDSEDAEHTYEAVVRALDDNQKAAVIAHRRAGDVQFHPRFLDLAGHYGFRPRACRPARAQTKTQASYCRSFRTCDAHRGYWRRSRKRLPGWGRGRGPVGDSKRSWPPSSARRARSTPSHAKRFAVV
jgi:hypothetical protein